MIESKRQEMIELIRRMVNGEGEDDLYGEWIETLRRVTGNPRRDDAGGDSGQVIGVSSVSDAATGARA